VAEMVRKFLIISFRFTPRDKRRWKKIVLSGIAELPIFLSNAMRRRSADEIAPRPTTISPLPFQAIRRFCSSDTYLQTTVPVARGGT